jgi:hypothetical protein
VELRQDARAPDARFDIGSDRLGVIDDRGGVIELRGERQLFDKAYEGVLLESSIATMGAASFRYAREA